MSHNEAEGDLRAIDLMTTNVLSVSADMPLEELALFFWENRIPGAPVVDEQMNVIGVVSETDLVRSQARTPEEPADDWAFFRTLGLEDIEAFDRRSQLEELQGKVVADIMTVQLVTATEDVEAPELALLMLSQRVHRVLVTKGRRLTGIVTTFDILKAVAARRTTRTRPSQSPKRGEARKDKRGRSPEPAA